MNKVYILKYDSYDGDHIVGLFNVKADARNTMIEAVVNANESITAAIAKEEERDDYNESYISQLKDRFFLIKSLDRFEANANNASYVILERDVI